jgi:hypothetical protein
MPFKKGQAGGPGRPKGLKNRKTLLLQELEKDGSALALAIKASALAGDSGAQSLWMSRVEPALKSMSQTVEFELDTSKPLGEQAAQVVKAMADGRISPDVVSQVMDALDRLAGIRQVDELAARIAALEAKG